MNVVFFGLLTFYFDHVDDSNRGRSFSKLFFLDKKYWLGTSDISSIPNQESKMNDNSVKENFLNSENKIIDTDSSSGINSIESDSVFLEKNKIMRSENAGTHFQGLRILGLNREFILDQKCCGPYNVLKALKEVSICFVIILDIL